MCSIFGYLGPASDCRSFFEMGRKGQHGAFRICYERPGLMRGGIDQTGSSTKAFLRFEGATRDAIAKTNTRDEH